MPNELSTGFNYESVDDDTRSKLAYYADRGHNLIRKSQIEFIAKMGEILSEAQAELSSNKSGTFIKWATSEFDITKQTVYNYVNAWENILSNGWTIYQSLSPTALYLLASDDTPAKAKKKAEHLAANSLTVRKADIERLIVSSKESGSDKGKPGGGSTTSSPSTPVADGPASSATAASESEEDLCPKCGHFDIAPIDSKPGESWRACNGCDYQWCETGEEAESGTEPQKETAPGEPGNGRDSTEGPGEIADKCPVCAGTKWVEDIEAQWTCCAKCGHFHGEPAGDADEDRVKTQRQKTVKTVEAAQRAFDDLNHIFPKPVHGEAVRLCKELLVIGREWK